MLITTTRRRLWALLLVTVFVAGPWTARSASAMTLSVQVDTAQPVDPGTSSIQVTIRADSELTLGATDITLNWDLDGIQVDSVSSPLTFFMSNIDNPARQVRTASAAGSTGDVVAAGDPLIIFSITANDAGTYTLFITDGDGVAPDDLAGPVPPIPPVSIAYTPVSGTLQVGPAIPLLSGPGRAALVIGMLLMVRAAARFAGS